MGNNKSALQPAYQTAAPKSFSFHVEKLSKHSKNRKGNRSSSIKMNLYDVSTSIISESKSTSIKMNLSVDEILQLCTSDHSYLEFRALISEQSLIE
jgi:hypothetical protein